MKTILSRLSITRGLVLRLLADGVLLQSALVLALIVWAFVDASLGFADSNTLSENIIGYFRWYRMSTIPLTLLCLVIFYLNGFYTFGLYYQSRYKTLVLLQAVIQSFALYGFLSYLMEVVLFPRPALVLAAIFSFAILAGARFWIKIWKETIQDEVKQTAEGYRPGRRSVLVIGGAGYIGSALLPKLLKEGYSVRVLDLMLFGEKAIADSIEHENLELIEGDFRHLETSLRALQGIDTVIHLGGIVGDPACSLDEALTIDVNLSATRMLAELARSSGATRFLFASTCSVYGACTEWLDEHSLAKPISLYGKTKLASEKILLDMASESFHTTCLRFATIYGFSGRTRFDLVVNLLTAKAKIEGKITIIGGDQWRPFVHVDDAALALALATSARVSLVSGQIFNVGRREQNHTIHEIGELVQKKVPEAKIEYQSLGGDLRNYKVNFDKIAKVLHYDPKWSLELGIEQILETIEKGKIENYQDPIYSNAEFLSTKGEKKLKKNSWESDLLEGI
ncbi:MAG: NAD-dependent epimerase/dehydratase family protein [Pirellulaceae bacterium]|nr:NAD-dependent epimerase/dehydratase family protein [Pirellulaceae bacterium]